MSLVFFAKYIEDIPFLAYLLGAAGILCLGIHNANLLPIITLLSSTINYNITYYFRIIL